MPPFGNLVDDRGRVMRDLRISLTDRCNFRCLYCLPETEEAANFYRSRFPGAPVSTKPIVREWKPKDSLLSYEEIERLVRIALQCGITKIRLTGGEPLLRRDVPVLVRKISSLPGLADLAMTTNGFLFQNEGRALKEAGLGRVSFSLDSLDSANFKKMTGREGLVEVLGGIRLALDLGFHPVKVNAVVIRGLNDHELESLVEWSRETGVHMRFIEFMPLDSGRAWQKELVVPGSEILTRLRNRFDLLPVAQRPDSSETARRWTFADGRGEIGIIAPVSEPFCGHCNRLRITADGKLRTCLFSLGEFDLKPFLRGRADDSEIARILALQVRDKEEGHRIGQPDFIQPQRTMSCIGG